MPELMQDLEKLVAIPSIAFPGYPSEPVHADGGADAGDVPDVGFTNARLMEVPTGYPPIYGEIPGPEGSPVVMLYAHYDVQPAPPEQGWTTDPWTPTDKRRADLRPRRRRRQGRAGDPPRHPADLRGQAALHGQADRGGDGGDREQPRGLRRGPSRAVRVRPVHRVRHGQPPRGRAGPDDRTCAATSPASSPCAPSSTRSTRACSAGRRPDAMMALARLLSTLVDDEGNVAVAGRDDRHVGGRRVQRGGPAVQRRPPRGCLARGLRSDRRPALGETVDQRDRGRHDEHRRLVERPDPRGPRQDLDADRPRLGARRRSWTPWCAHLESHAPWGAQVEVERTKEAPGFRCETDGPGLRGRTEGSRGGLREACGDAARGGSIPLLRTLQGAAPRAEFILWGPEDVAAARIHASDESVDPSEIEKMVVAQALLIQLPRRAAVTPDAEAPDERPRRPRRRGTRGPRRHLPVHARGQRQHVGGQHPAPGDQRGHRDVVHDVAVGGHRLLAGGRRDHRDVRFAG